MSQTPEPYAAPRKPPKYALWLDPGETTGWALWYFEQETLFMAEYEREEIGRFLERWMSTGGRHTVLGCEKFTITAHTARLSQQPAALEIIGVARHLAQKYRAPEFRVDQTPAQAKSFCTDAMLRRLGWYKAALGHANDAARHLLTYLTTTSQLPRDLQIKLYPELGERDTLDPHGSAGSS